MRSTKVFLTKPFETADKHNKHRADAIEKRLQKERAQLTQSAGNNAADSKSVLLIPEEYQDILYNFTMHEPYDIKLCDAADSYHIDQTTLRGLRESGEPHPVSKQPMPHGSYKNGKYIEAYPLNADLAQRINVFLTIEELKFYIADCEQERQQNIMRSLDKKLDMEAANILRQLEIVHTSDQLHELGIPLDSIPEKFRGDGKFNTVMTLPVIIDGKFTIDFFELLKTFPTNRSLTEQEAAQHLVKLHSKKQTCIDKINDEMDKLNAASLAEFEKTKIKILDDIRSFDDQRVTEEKIQDLEQTHRSTIAGRKMIAKQQIAGIEKLTMNSFIEGKEYRNPYTDQPIKAIAINNKLLAEIDRFIDPFERQMQIVREQASSFERKLGSRSYGNEELKELYKSRESYAKILEEEKYPEALLPVGLAKGGIPGTNYVEIMKHPVLLDGTLWIDLDRLLEYWKPVSGFFFSSPSRYGLNPFNHDQPIKTITYDVHIKECTDKFMVNRKGYKQTTTTKQASDPKYLCKFTTFYAGTARSSRPEEVSAMLLSSIGKN